MPPRRPFLSGHDVKHDITFFCGKTMSILEDHGKITAARLHLKICKVCSGTNVFTRSYDLSNVIQGRNKVTTKPRPL